MTLLINEMAQLAKLAYLIKEDIVSFNEQIKLLNYTLKGNFTANSPINKNLEIFGFVASCNDKTVLSFKGTDNIEDFITDAEIDQIAINKTTSFNWLWWLPKKPKMCMVHAGFNQSYQSCKDQVLALLNGISGDFYVVGHSLGGAIASIAALDLKNMNPKVYTFASPKVGNSEFVSEYNNSIKESYRISNKYDIVPMLPPAQFIDYDLDETWEYQHVNTLIPVAFQNYEIVANHKIDNYIKATQNI